jgi:hypothetical protein
MSDNAWAQSNDAWAKLRQRHCDCLRSKEMFYDNDFSDNDLYDNGIPLEDRNSSGIFWCSQTHRSLGPDGETVGMEDCGPHRPCFRR